MDKMDAQTGNESGDEARQYVDAERAGVQMDGPDPEPASALLKGL